MCLYGFASVQSWSFAVGASLPRQSFVPLHRATALCGCLYASLHNGFVWLSLCILAYRLFATTCKHPCLKPLGVHFRHPCLFMNALLALRPCLVSHQCRCVLQRLSVADFKHPCLKPLGVHFRHPCLACPSRYINRLHYRKPCNLSAKCLKSFLPLTDFVLYSITQDHISLSAKIVF